MVEASGRIADLTGRLRELDASLTDSQSRENKLLKDFEENTRRYREAKHKISQLKGIQVKLNSHFRKQCDFYRNSFSCMVECVSFNFIHFNHDSHNAKNRVKSIVDFSDVSTLGKDYFHYYALFGDSCVKF